MHHTGGIINSTVGGTFYNGTTAARFVMDADLGVPVLQCSKVSEALSGLGSRAKTLYLRP